MTVNETPTSRWLTSERKVITQIVTHTAGVVELTPNAYGYSTGSVLDGGSISISGNLLAGQGAVFDVSGANGVLDVQPTQAGNLSNRISTISLVSTRVDSNGGSISLSGGQELFSAAT